MNYSIQKNQWKCLGFGLLFGTGFVQIISNFYHIYLCCLIRIWRRWFITQFVVAYRLRRFNMLAKQILKSSICPSWIIFEPLFICKMRREAFKNTFPQSQLQMKNNFLFPNCFPRVHLFVQHTLWDKFKYLCKCIASARAYFLLRPKIFGIFCKPVLKQLRKNLYSRYLSGETI